MPRELSPCCRLKSRGCKVWAFFVVLGHGHGQTLPCCAAKSELCSWFQFRARRNAYSSGSSSRSATSSFRGTADRWYQIFLSKPIRALRTPPCYLSRTDDPRGALRAISKRGTPAHAADHRCDRAISPVPRQQTVTFGNLDEDNPYRTRIYSPLRPLP